MTSVRHHILTTLDVLQAIGDAALAAAEGGDERRSATLLLDVRDATRAEQDWLGGLAPGLGPRTLEVLTSYRLALAQVEVLAGKVVERLPEFDEKTTRRCAEGLIRLLTLRIEVGRLGE